MHNVLVFFVNFEHLFSPRQHYTGEEVYWDDGMSSQEEVKQPCYIPILLYVVGKHGKGIGQCEGSLRFGQMVIQFGVGSCEYGVKQREMGDGGIEGGEHKVPDAQQAQTRDSCGGFLRAKDEQEDLDYVVIALEVVQGGVAADSLDDYVGKVFFQAAKLVF